MAEGHAANKRGAFDEARRCFEQAAALDGQASHRISAANMRLKSGDVAAAAKEYTALLESPLEPHHRLHVQRKLDEVHTLRVRLAEMLVERVEPSHASQMTPRVVVIGTEDPFHVAVRGLRERQRLRCSDLQLPILVARSRVVVEPPDAALRQDES